MWDRLAASYVDHVLIDGHIYKSVKEFVCKGGSLKKGMLHKFAQNIPYQKVFSSTTTFKQWADTQQLPDPIAQYLRDQFQPCTQSQILNFLKGPTKTLCGYQPQLVTEVCELFRRCQPFVGKDRALIFVQLWLNKKLYKCMYEPPVEALLTPHLIA